MKEDIRKDEDPYTPRKSDSKENHAKIEAR